MWNHLSASVPGLKNGNAMYFSLVFLTLDCLFLREEITWFYALETQAIRYLGSSWPRLVVTSVQSLDSVGQPSWFPRFALIFSTQSFTMEKTPQSRQIIMATDTPYSKLRKCLYLCFVSLCFSMPLSLPSRSFKVQPSSLLRSFSYAIFLHEMPLLLLLSSSNFYSLFLTLLTFYLQNNLS